MAITLMYITNNPELALIAQEAGVDRIWIDLETFGKERRQAGLNTVKSRHYISDIAKIKPLLTTSKLQVRINPLYDWSKEEIDAVIKNGAEIVMLPMYKTKNDVLRFIDYVDGRAKVLLLLETAEAAENLEDYIDTDGIDEIHIGLNDLHLAYNKTFMFELLTDGTIQSLSQIMRDHNMRFGFGGFARMGYGTLPAELILAEHYMFGSEMAILSRGFCDANIVPDPKEIQDDFIKGIRDIRFKEEEIQNYTREQFIYNHNLLSNIVDQIAQEMNSDDSER